MEYFGNLPKAKYKVRKPFELGRAAMKSKKWDEAIDHFQAAMNHAAGAELAALHYLAGRCFRTPARQAQAMQSYEESARLAEQFGDKQLRANVLNGIGGLWRDAGDFEKSLASHEQSLKLAQEAGVRPEQAEALNGIGGYHVFKDSPDKAFRYFQDALRIFEETGDRKGQTAMLANLGMASTDMGEPDKALDYSEKSLALAREIGDKGLEAAAHADIGGRWLKDDPDKALDHMEEALRLFREAGARRGEVPMLSGVGDILTTRGEYEKAVPRLVEALRVVADFGQWSWSGSEQARRTLGRCLDALGRDKFIAACEKAGMLKPETEKLVKELVLTEGKI